MTELTTQFTPEQWSELLAGYVLGDLTPTETSLVEAYLAADPTRQIEVANLRLSLDLLPLALPADLPPAALRQQIIQMAEGKTVATTTPIDRPTAQPRTHQLWRSILAGFGLLVCAGLGWNNYRLSQKLATVQQELQATRIAQNPQKYQTYQSVVSLLQQPNNRFFSLKNKEGKSMGTGSLVIAPQKLSAVLSLQRILPLPQGQVYRMWAITGAEENACAEFLPDDEGNVLIQVPLGHWEKANKVMIKIEQKGAQSTEGKVAIEGEVGV